jgi:hypothetical protein
MSDQEQVETVSEPADDSEAIPPAWYPEPDNPEQKRYWDGEAWGKRWKDPKPEPTGKANRLAVAALICSCIGPVLVGGILGTVFGLVALEEIEETEGTERGQGMAKWAIGLGFVNIALSLALIVLLTIALSK